MIHTIYLAGGCFWCMEAVFSLLAGVNNVTPGYSGGASQNPTYNEVCSGISGHKEIIAVEFDNSIISYEDLLEIFFISHDPTSEKQGADTGDQYKSVIYCNNEHERVIAFKMINKYNIENKFDKPIITELIKFEKFYPAEEEHNDYYKRNPHAPYCIYNILPKIRKIKVNYKEKLNTKN